MKNKHILLGIVILLAALVVILVLPRYVHGEYVTTPKFTIDKTLVDNQVDNKIFVIRTVEKPSLNPAQIIWLARLMNCESGIKASAVNPNDLDNTPSWGLLQFKQGTFDSFTAKYGIKGDIMDGEAQVKIVTEWLLRPGEVDFSWQFPACVKKIGLPPQ